MAYAGYDRVSAGEKCVTPVMYGLHSRVARCRHRADAPSATGQFDPHDHAQHAPAIEALFLAEEHSGELRRMISS